VLPGNSRSGTKYAMRLSTSSPRLANRLRFSQGTLSGFRKHFAESVAFKTSLSASNGEVERWMIYTVRQG
jgi:hypothetical protein